MAFSFVSDPAIQTLFDNTTKLNIGSTEFTKTFRSILDKDVDTDGTTGSMFLAEYFQDNSSTYGKCGNFYWKSVEVKQSGSDGRPIYEITINYDNTGQDSTIVQGEQYPTNIAENAQYRWGTNQVQIGLEYDYNGNRMKNTAGEAFVQVLEQEIYNTTYSVTKSVSIPQFTIYNPLVKSALGSVNQNTVVAAGGSFNPKCALFKNFTSDAVYTADFDLWYFRVTCEFEIVDPVAINGVDVNGNAVTTLYSHQRAVLNQGTYYIDEARNQQVFRNAGEKSEQPGNLAADGNALEPNAEPIFVVYQTRPLVDWSNIIGLID